MKRVVCLWILLVSLLFAACKNDQELHQEAEQMASEQFKDVDLTTIDTYPYFSACDELVKSPDCLYRNLHQVIDDQLKRDSLKWRLAAKDSVLASITIDKEGNIRYDSLVRCAASIDKVSMDSMLRVRLSNLPQIKSALKKDIPVQSSYLLPITLKPNDSIQG